MDPEEYTAYYGSRGRVHIVTSFPYLPLGKASGNRSLCTLRNGLYMIKDPSTVQVTTYTRPELAQKIRDVVAGDITTGTSILATLLNENGGKGMENNFAGIQTDSDKRGNLGASFMHYRFPWPDAKGSKGPNNNRAGIREFAGFNTPHDCIKYVIEIWNYKVDETRKMYAEYGLPFPTEPDEIWYVTYIIRWESDNRYNTPSKVNIHPERSRLVESNNSLYIRSKALMEATKYDSNVMEAIITGAGRLIVGYKRLVTDLFSNNTKTQKPYLTENEITTLKNWVTITYNQKGSSLIGMVQKAIDSSSQISDTTKRGHLKNQNATDTCSEICWVIGYYMYLKFYLGDKVPDFTSYYIRGINEGYIGKASAGASKNKNAFLIESYKCMKTYSTDAKSSRAEARITGSASNIIDKFKALKVKLGVIREREAHVILIGVKEDGGTILFDPYHKNVTGQSAIWRYTVQTNKKVKLNWIESWLPGNVSSSGLSPSYNPSGDPVTSIGPEMKPTATWLTMNPTEYRNITRYD